MERFTVVDLFRRFPDDHACVAHLARERWGCDPAEDGMDCEKCGGHRAFRYIETRKCYACADCKAQVRPTAGTIFHGSRTPLTIWFYVFFQMASTRMGVAAKQVERETGVTYKTAWRMCHLVRAALAERSDECALFSGVVEVDETYMGARVPRYPRRPGRPRPEDKQPVIGIVERGGALRAYVVPDVRRATVLPLIQRHAEDRSTVYTDEYPIYKTLPNHGYDHAVVRHKAKEYVRKEVDEATGEVTSVHTNTVEGAWGLWKSTVLGVHRGVSRFYLQRYADEFAFRYSHRDDEAPLCLTMLSRAASSGRPSVRPAPMPPG